MKLYAGLAGGFLLITSCSHKDPNPNRPNVDKPSADFTTSDKPQASEAIQFKNISQNATSYAWNFGDGSADKTANPAHIYLKVGIYPVTLRAYSSQNDSATSTQNLIVGEYNIFSHTSTKIAGTYDCKVYRNVRYTSPTSINPPDTNTRLPDDVFMVTETGPQTLAIHYATLHFGDEGTTGTYEPALYPGSSGWPFKLLLTDDGSVYFYPTGDSLIFHQNTHEGHGTATTDYYRGHRRP